MTNSNSCASGVISVGEAMRYIRDDMADVMLAGGPKLRSAPLTFGAFDFIKTMPRRAAIRLSPAAPLISIATAS